MGQKIVENYYSLEVCCLDCDKELEIIDTTYSNTGNTQGQKTGDIYFCDDCKIHFINDYLLGQVRVWAY